MQPRQNRSWTSPFIAVACLLRKCVLSFPLVQISEKKKKTKDYNPKENKIHYLFRYNGFTWIDAHKDNEVNRFIC